MSNGRVTRGLALALLLVAVGTTAAYAHEGRDVGPLEILVGFGEEPAYTGQPNSAQVQLSRDGQPVSGAGGLEVEVSFGDASMTLPLEEGGTPGDYRASFVPSQPGDYTFRVRGRIGGERFDESFTSSPTTFSDVQDPSAAAFPPVDAPSNVELASRIETESARTAALERAAEGARQGASDARSTAVTAMVVGAIGIIAAIGALVVARRS